MHELIHKYFQGTLDAGDELELFRQMETDKELQAEFARYQNTHALLSFTDVAINEKDSRRGYKTFVSRTRRRKVYRLALRTIGQAAAVLLVALGVHFYHITQKTPDIVAQSETSLFVPAGQRVSITLEDGTVVWLNAQTQITYPTAFAGQERRVKIEGEAYFDVARDTERPFIVSTRDAEMTVLGTEFNVYSYPEESVSRISLVEGSLLVSQAANPAQTIQLKPSEEVTIAGSSMQLGTISNSDYFLWVDGIYSFENETFENILKRLELYYDIEIIVENPAMLSWRYTVKFRQRDGINEILRLLQRVYSFNVRRDDENNRIIIH